MFILNFIRLHYLVLLPCYLVHKSCGTYPWTNDTFVLLGKSLCRGVQWYIVHRIVLKKKAFDNNSVMYAKNIKHSSTIDDQNSIPNGSPLLQPNGSKGGYGAEQITLFLLCLHVPSLWNPSQAHLSPQTFPLHSGSMSRTSKDWQYFFLLPFLKKKVTFSSYIFSNEYDIPFFLKAFKGLYGTTFGLIGTYSSYASSSYWTYSSTTSSISTRRYFALEHPTMMRNPRDLIRIVTCFILDWCQQLRFQIKICFSYFMVFYFRCDTIEMNCHHR